MGNENIANVSSSYLPLHEYKKLPIEARARVELSNLLLKLMDCKWYQLGKKQRIYDHINLIISTYSLEKLAYV